MVDSRTRPTTERGVAGSCVVVSARVVCLIDLFLDFVGVREPLEVYSLFEELIEREFVFHHEINVTASGHKRFYSKDVRRGEAIKVEGARNIRTSFCVPFKGGNTNLEGICPLDTVLIFLVPSLRLVKTVDAVGFSDIERGKLGVKRHIVTGLDRVDDEVEFLSEVGPNNIHV